MKNNTHTHNGQNKRTENNARKLKTTQKTQHTQPTQRKHKNKTINIQN